MTVLALFMHVRSNGTKMLQHKICRVVGHTALLQRAVPQDKRIRSFATQNRKYRCAIGNTVAGSQVSSTPSARTS